VKIANSPQKEHPFVSAPHKTLLSMSFPVLMSLVAESLTGLIDTAFVARLGSESLAALGVGTVTLSGIFWVLNFLGIGTQTEVAQAQGRHESGVAREVGGSALASAALIGLLLVALGLPLVPYVSTVMGATSAVFDLSSQYIQIRLFGAPAVLITIAALAFSGECRICVRHFMWRSASIRSTSSWTHCLFLVTARSPAWAF
jgi:MATE family multidrug resistance protein